MRIPRIVLVIAICISLDSGDRFNLFGQRAADFESLVCRNATAGDPTGVVGITIHSENNQWERTQTAEAAQFFDSVRGPWVVVAGVLTMRNTANTAVAGDLNPDPHGRPVGTSIAGRSFEKGLILSCTVQ